MTAIGDIVSIVKGRKAAEVFDEPCSGTHRYLQIEDLRPGPTLKYARTPDGVLATDNDVLIAWDGANAGTVGFGVSGYVGSTLAVLRPKKQVCTSYLGYFLQSRFKVLRDGCTGATIPHINRAALEALDIRLASLSEQQLIASALEKADRLRRTRQYAKHLSDTFLLSVFLQMFVDEHSSAWPLEKVEEVLKNGRNSIRTGPFGSQLLHSEFVDEGVAVLGIDNVVQNQFTWDKRRFITQQKYQELKRYTVFPGDVLITIMGTCGRCAVVPDDIPCAINTKHLCCITLDQEQCLPSYLQAAFLMHPKVLQQLGVSSRGAVMPGMNMGIIKDLSVPVPPIALQKDFDAIVRRVQRLQRQQQEAGRQSEQLFQALLSQAFERALE